MHLTVKYVFVLVLMVAPIVGHGQKVDVELLAGPNLGSLRGNELLNGYYTSKIDLTAGLGLTYSLAQTFSVGIKLLYEKKGSIGEIPVIINNGFSGDVLLGKTEIRVDYQYASLPVTVKYSFGAKVRFSGELGLFTGYLIKSVASSEEFDTFPASSQDVTSTHKKFDFGVAVGFGASIPVAEKITAKVTLLDNLGLLNISDLPVVNGEAIRTNTVNLLLGVSYRLK